MHKQACRTWHITLPGGRGVFEGQEGSRCPYWLNSECKDHPCPSPKACSVALNVEESRNRTQGGEAGGGPGWGIRGAAAGFGIRNHVQRGWLRAAAWRRLLFLGSWVALLCWQWETIRHDHLPLRSHSPLFSARARCGFCRQRGWPAMVTLTQG